MVTGEAASFLAPAWAAVSAQVALQFFNADLPAVAVFTYNKDTQLFHHLRAAWLHFRALRLLRIPVASYLDAWQGGQGLARALLARLRHASTLRAQDATLAHLTAAALVDRDVKETILGSDLPLLALKAYAAGYRFIRHYMPPALPRTATLLQQQQAKHAAARLAALNVALHMLSLLRLLGVTLAGSGSIATEVRQRALEPGGGVELRDVLGLLLLEPRPRYWAAVRPPSITTRGDLFRPALVQVTAQKLTPGEGAGGVEAAGAMQDGANTADDASSAVGFALDPVLLAKAQWAIKGGAPMADPALSPTPFLGPPPHHTPGESTHSAVRHGVLQGFVFGAAAAELTGHAGLNPLARQAGRGLKALYTAPSGQSMANRLQTLFPPAASQQGVEQGVVDLVVPRGDQWRGDHIDLRNPRRLRISRPPTGDWQDVQHSPISSPSRGGELDIPPLPLHRARADSSARSSAPSEPSGRQAAPPLQHGTEARGLYTPAALLRAAAPGASDGALAEDGSRTIVRTRARGFVPTAADSSVGSAGAGTVLYAGGEVVRFGPTGTVSGGAQDTSLHRQYFALRQGEAEDRAAHAAFVAKRQHNQNMGALDGAIAEQVRLKAGLRLATDTGPVARRRAASAAAEAPAPVDSHQAGGGLAARWGSVALPASHTPLSDDASIASDTSSGGEEAPCQVPALQPGRQGATSKSKAGPWRDAAPRALKALMAVRHGGRELVRAAAGTRAWLAPLYTGTAPSVPRAPDRPVQEMVGPRSALAATLSTGTPVSGLRALEPGEALQRPVFLFCDGGQDVYRSERRALAEALGNWGDMGAHSSDDEPLPAGWATVRNAAWSRRSEVGGGSARHRRAPHQPTQQADVRAASLARQVIARQRHAVRAYGGADVHGHGVQGEAHLPPVPVRLQHTGPAPWRIRGSLPLYPAPTPHDGPGVPFREPERREGPQELAPGVPALDLGGVETASRRVQWVQDTVGDAGVWWVRRRTAADVPTYQRPHRTGSVPLDATQRLPRYVTRKAVAKGLRHSARSGSYYGSARPASLEDELAMERLEGFGTSPRHGQHQHDLAVRASRVVHSATEERAFDRRLARSRRRAERARQAKHDKYRGGRLPHAESDSEHSSQDEDRPSGSESSDEGGGLSTLASSSAAHKRFLRPSQALVGTGAPTAESGFAPRRSKHKTVTPYTSSIPAGMPAGLIRPRGKYLSDVQAYLKEAMQRAQGEVEATSAHRSAHWDTPLPGLGDWGSAFGMGSSSDSDEGGAASPWTGLSSPGHFALRHSPLRSPPSRGAASPGTSKVLARHASHSLRRMQRNRTGLSVLDPRHPQAPKSLMAAYGVLGGATPRGSGMWGASPRRFPAALRHSGLGSKHLTALAQARVGQEALMRGMRAADRMGLHAPPGLSEDWAEGDAVLADALGLAPGTVVHPAAGVLPSGTTAVPYTSDLVLAQARARYLALTETRYATALTDSDSSDRGRVPEDSMWHDMHRRRSPKKRREAPQTPPGRHQRGPLSPPESSSEEEPDTASKPLVGESSSEEEPVRTPLRSGNVSDSSGPILHVVPCSTSESESGSDDGQSSPRQGSPMQGLSTPLRLPHGLRRSHDAGAVGLKRGVGYLGKPLHAAEQAAVGDVEAEAAATTTASLAHQNQVLGTHDDVLDGDAELLRGEEGGGAGDSDAGVDGTPLPRRRRGSTSAAPPPATATSSFQAMNASGNWEGGIEAFVKDTDATASVMADAAELEALAAQLADLPPPGRILVQGEGVAHGGPPDVPGRDRIDWELLQVLQHVGIALLLQMESVVEAQVAQGLRPARHSLSLQISSMRASVVRRYLRGLVDTVADFTRQSVLVMRIWAARHTLQADAVEAEVAQGPPEQQPGQPAAQGQHRDPLATHDPAFVVLFYRATRLLRLFTAAGHAVSALVNSSRKQALKEAIEAHPKLDPHKTEPLLLLALGQAKDASLRLSATGGRRGAVARGAAPVHVA